MSVRKFYLPTSDYPIDGMPFPLPINPLSFVETDRVREIAWLDPFRALWLKLRLIVTSCVVLICTFQKLDQKYSEFLI